MEETTNNNNANNNNTAAAAESVIDSIKRLMEAVGNDDELKEKLEDALAAMTGERSGRKKDAENDDPAEPENAAGEEEDDADDGEEDGEKEEKEDDDTVVSSAATDLSDIFTEDALAGMVVGFIAGAAVVGGGVLLHKVLSDN